ncbi:MAG: GC-type dockerin domain-anchored protein [Planctomycetota bacterium]
MNLIGSPCGNSRARITALVVVVGLAAPILAQGPLEQPFPQVLPFDDVGRGGTGVTIVTSEPAFIGNAVSSAGDVNGDGVDDVLVGHRFADPLGRRDAGEAFVVFGQDPAAGSGLLAVIDLADLDGTNGFRLIGGSERAAAGTAVAAAGDINADGIDDIVIGAPGVGLGTAYVVFGRDSTAGESFPAQIDLGASLGGGGFRIDATTAVFELGASAAAAGDVNADGIDDLIVGAPRTTIGAAFVVFGRDSTAGETFPGILGVATLDGGNGFRIDGSASFGRAGESVGGGFDANGDGIDDVIVGAPGDDIRGAAVVFGRDATGGPAFPARIDIDDLDGTDGFGIGPISGFDDCGYSVAAAGDVNGDGVDDAIIGAPRANRGASNAGEAYVVFGRDGGGFPALLPLATLDGTNGFRINTGEKNAEFGRSVASAGDINGDGIDDLVAGAPGYGYYEATPPYSYYSYGDIGAGYVLFGRAAGFPAEVDARFFDEGEGILLPGGLQDERAAASVAHAGDINADGAPDVIFGARGAGRNGEAYVLFGRDLSSCPADVDGDGELTVFDFLEFQNLFDAGDLAADFDGDGVLTIFDFLEFQNAFALGCP